MSSYGAGSGGFKTSQAGLAGPGSSYTSSDAYGYGSSYEGANGSVYTHAHYVYGGVTTDYRSYSYAGPTSYYSSVSAYRSFPSPAQASASGGAAPPYSGAYGYETRAYAHSTLTDAASGSEVLQTRTFSSDAAYSSGYTVSYSDAGSSTFDHGAFVAGSASNYAVSGVTDPYGYTAYTSHMSRY